MKKAVLALISSFARHHAAEHLLKCAQLLRFSMSWNFKSTFNARLRKVIIRTLKRFLNFRCPTVSNFRRFRFFIQLRLQSASRVM